MVQARIGHKQIKNAKRSADEASPYGTLDGIRRVLDNFSPPGGSFDPAGSWKHTYAIWLEENAGPAGYFEIAREPSGGGIALTVESAIAQSTGAVQQIKAKIQCAADALATPKSWELESSFLDSSGRPVAAVRLTETARVSKGSIESQFGRAKGTRKLPLPFTSNWSLFEAVQRLPGPDAAALRFALLEDLDLIKPNQRLSFAEKTSVSVAGGRDLALKGYERIGEGALPYRYWVDDQHRLLFALTGPRAYVYDAEARGKIAPGQNVKKGKRAKKG
jgi:hypothetical protein